MSEELQEFVPLEEHISQELVKHNVTQAVISTLNEKYGHLKIAGLEDKETYLLVKEGRKECKAFRVAAKKICEKGREKAVAEQKAWVAKQKEVTDLIAAIEDPLEEQEKAYEAAVAKDKEERKRRHEEQLIMRQQVLTGMGALYSNGSFCLGEVVFELDVVKESDPEIWEEVILPKFKAEYEKVEAERIEQDRIKQEQEAEMKRQQEELERKQREIEQREAALKAAQEEQERKEREEHDRRMAEAKAKEEAKWKVRADQLQALGLKIEFFNNHLYYNGYDCSISHLDITGYSDEKWNEMIEKITAHIASMKALEEQKRLAEIEEQKEKERKKAIGESRLEVLMKIDSAGNFTVAELGDMDNEGWNAMLGVKEEVYNKKQKEKWEAEQEEKRKQDQLLEQQRMDQAKDKEKWAEILKRINEIEVYEMRSQQYRKKAAILREKLDEIKSL